MTTLRVHRKSLQTCHACGPASILCPENASYTFIIHFNLLWHSYDVAMTFYNNEFHKCRKQKTFLLIKTYNRLPLYELNERVSHLARRMSSMRTNVYCMRVQLQPCAALLNAANIPGINIAFAYNSITHYSSLYENIFKYLHQRRAAGKKRSASPFLQEIKRRAFHNEMAAS